MNRVNFRKALKLLKLGSAYRTCYSADAPKMQLYDGENLGYSIWIKTDTMNQEFSEFLHYIAEDQGFTIRQRDHFTVVSSF